MDAGYTTIAHNLVHASGKVIHYASHEVRNVEQFKFVGGRTTLEETGRIMADVASNQFLNNLIYGGKGLTVIGDLLPTLPRLQRERAKEEAAKQFFRYDNHSDFNVFEFGQLNNQDTHSVIDPTATLTLRNEPASVSMTLAVPALTKLGHNAFPVVRNRTLVRGLSEPPGYEIPLAREDARLDRDWSQHRLEAHRLAPGPFQALKDGMPHTFQLWPPTN